MNNLNYIFFKKTMKKGWKNFLSSNKLRNLRLFWNSEFIKSQQLIKYNICEKQT